MLSTEQLHKAPVASLKAMLRIGTDELELFSLGDSLTLLQKPILDRKGPWYMKFMFFMSVLHVVWERRLSRFI